MVKSWPWSQPHTAWMMPQYSEDSVLWRLGRDTQLAACSCTQPTKLCRHRGLEVIRSAGENQQRCQSHGGQHEAQPGMPTLAPTALTHASSLLCHCGRLNTKPAKHRCGHGLGASQGHQSPQDPSTSSPVPSLLMIAHHPQISANLATTAPHCGTIRVLHWLLSTPQVNTQDAG